MAYRSPKPAGNYSYTPLENQNDQKIDGISQKLNALRNITVNIQDEVRQQNRLLNDMDTDFDSSQGLLGATMHRLGITTRSGGTKLICYLAGFSLFVLFTIYFLASRGGE
ncbi:unnamed protein product, partial [Mesorhabditis spiculigera]